MNRNQDIGDAISSYREFRPPPALAEFLLCFWTQTISPSSRFTQRVLPDCCADIVLMNGLPIVIGPATEPFDAHLPAGTRVLGVRCHPGLASSLLGVPASELLNQSVPLCDLWGSSGTADYARVAEQTTLVAQLGAMERALLARVANASPIDNATREGIQWIARHPHERVERLSQWLNLSSRQIQVKGLKPASSLGAEFLTYVVWVVTPEGRTGNTGELLLNKNGDGKLTATTPAQAFSLIVTAEPYFAVRMPSEMVALQSEPGKKTEGKIFPVSEYKLMKRAQYEKEGNPLALAPDPKTPLSIYEARSALEVAKSRQAVRLPSEIIEHSHRGSVGQRYSSLDGDT